MAELFDKRQRVAHEQIDTVQEYLRNPRAVLFLGEEAAQRMVSLAEKLYVPNIVDGKITPEEGGIPVVSLKTGERITHNAGLSSEQKQRIIAATRGRYNDTDHLEQLLHSKDIVLPRQAVGVTLTQKAMIDVGPAGYELRGSPAIILNNQRIDGEGYSTTTLAHELVHAGQALARPVRQKTGHSYMKEEAQAYNVQSKLMHSLNLDGGTKADRVHRVSQAYELWKRQGLSLDTEEDVTAFSDMLHTFGVSPIHPHQHKKP